MGGAVVLVTASSRPGQSSGHCGPVMPFSDSMRPALWAASGVRGRSVLLCARSSGLGGLSSSLWAPAPARKGVLAPPGHPRPPAQWPRAAKASFTEDNKCISINVLYRALSKVPALCPVFALAPWPGRPSAASGPGGSLPRWAPTQPAPHPSSYAPLLVCLHLQHAPSPSRVPTPLPQGALVSHALVPSLTRPGPLAPLETLLTMPSQCQACACKCSVSAQGSPGPAATSAPIAAWNRG